MKEDSLKTSEQQLCTLEQELEASKQQLTLYIEKLDQIQTTLEKNEVKREYL